jgi:DNA-directed RNA polymerase subunit alpha
LTEEIIVPEVKLILEDGNRSEFSVEPLSPGYGLTLGNALRRVLLSSLTGAAAYAVKIEGATHEFTTLPGLKEDIVRLIINIKQLNFSLTDSEEAVLKLKVKGKSVVTGADIAAPSGCKVLNPDQVIAHLEKNTGLDIEIFVDKGRGHVGIDKRDEKSYPTEMILVDSAYSPIKAVNFEVEDMRVGQATDYNRLLLDIESDGGVTPAEALKQASEILSNQFEVVKGSIQTEQPKKVAAKAKKTKAKAPKKTEPKQAPTKTKITKAKK